MGPGKCIDIHLLPSSYNVNNTVTFKLPGSYEHLILVLFAKDERKTPGEDKRIL